MATTMPSMTIPSITVSSLSPRMGIPHKFAARGGREGADAAVSAATGVMPRRSHSTTRMRRAEFGYTIGMTFSGWATKMPLAASPTGLYTHVTGTAEAT